MIRNVRIEAAAERKIITLDGQPLNGVVNAALALGRPGELPVLTVDLAVSTQEVDGEMRVTLPKATREGLIALGWTPPEV